MRKIAPLAVAAVLVLAGCGGGDTKTAQPGKPASDDFTEGVVTPAPPKRLPWGQPAEILGANGGKLRITPLGLLYSKGEPKSSSKPENGWFVAIAIRAEAVDKPDSTAAPASGGGFTWKGNSERITTVDGNAVTTSWVGAVHEFSITPIQPGEPEVGIETFDVPTKTGGRLEYINPEDQSVTSWDLPATDQGTGLDKVRKRIKLFS